MDFTSNQTTEEIFDPESISTRSEQNSQDESTDRPARGVPGAAVANQAHFSCWIYRLQLLKLENLQNSSKDHPVMLKTMKLVKNLVQQLVKLEKLRKLKRLF